MGKEIIFMVEEEEIKGGFTAQALGYGIFTEAETIEELKTMIQDAVHCSFDKSEMPSIIRLHIVKDEVIPA